MNISARNQTKPLTIGVILSDFGSYASDIWRGIADTAKGEGVKLVSFVGGYLREVAEFSDKEQLVYKFASLSGKSRLVYKFISPQTVDGLIIFSSLLSNFASPEVFTEFYQPYLALPLVSLGQVIPHVPSVTIDNTTGLYQLMVHLIEVHGYRRLAFIKGVEGNQDAEERYQIYLQVLADYDLPFDPDLVVPGEFVLESGRKAVSLLLDERKVLCDVIISANDDMASGAIEAIQKRGLQVPGDLAVTGFDDARFSQSIAPPLTTVRQPLYELGCIAFEQLYKQLQGETVSLNTVVPTQMVIRESCGCLAKSVQQANWFELPPHLKGENFDLLTPHTSNIVTAMRELMHQQNVRLDDEAALTQLVEALQAELQGQSPTSFLLRLDRYAHQTLMRGQNIDDCHLILSILRGLLVPTMSATPQLMKLETILHQGRVILSKLAQTTAYQLEERRLIQFIMLHLGPRLMRSTNLAHFMTLLAENLPQLGVTSAYVMLYDPESTSAVVPPTWLRLWLAYTPAGRIALPEDGLRFPFIEMLPPEVWVAESFNQLFVEALYFKDQIIGFIILEMDAPTEIIYIGLLQQLMAALPQVLLIQEIQQANQEIQRANADLAKANTDKDKFFSIMAHDLKGPFMPLLGNAEILTEFSDILKPPQVKEIGSSIHRSARNAFGLLESLLTWARLQMGRMEYSPQWLDIYEIAAKNVELLSGNAAVKQIELRNQVAVGTWVYVDENMLDTVIRNLTNNALKFTPQGGQVTIAARELGVEVYDSLHPLPTNNYIEVSVADTGVGMSKETRQKLFQLDQHVTTIGTGKETGTGLGLIICQEMVIKSGGRIWVESEVGQGTTVKFSVLCKS